MIREICLAGGCFWGVQKYFDQVNGVIRTECGYANSNVKNPRYREVCGGSTNAAEAVKIAFDDAVIPLDGVLRLFFDVIDPTLLNRQGNDAGTQYRTGIYSDDPADLAAAAEFAAEEQKQYVKPIVTEIRPLENFTPAEEYHQKYLEKNPFGYCHVSKEELDHARHYAVSEAG